MKSENMGNIYKKKKVPRNLCSICFSEIPERKKGKEEEKEKREKTREKFLQYFYFVR